MDLIKRIENFIEKQRIVSWSGKGGRKPRKLKPYLKFGGKLLPREEVERRKMGVGEGPRRK